MMSKEEKMIYQREWRKSHPHYSRDKMREWRANPENRVSEKQRSWYNHKREGVIGKVERGES